MIEKKELCDEEPKIAFSSIKRNKSPGYDDISSNVINNIGRNIWRFKAHVTPFNQSRCLSRKHEDCNCLL